MRKNLTAKLIENLQPHTDRRYEVRDLLLPGFGVRVSVNGGKSWFAVARINGRQVRHTIGNYPTVTLGEAREAARLILKDIQLGLYAPAKATPDASPPTLAQMDYGDSALNHLSSPAAWIVVPLRAGWRTCCRGVRRNRDGGVGYPCGRRAFEGFRNNQKYR